MCQRISRRHVTLRRHAHNGMDCLHNAHTRLHCCFIAPRCRCRIHRVGVGVGVGPTGFHFKIRFSHIAELCEFSSFLIFPNHQFVFFVSKCIVMTPSKRSRAPGNPGVDLRLIPWMNYSLKLW